MPITAHQLRTDMRAEPLGKDTAVPEFAWRLRTEEPGVAQTAYQVQASAGAWFRVSTGHRDSDNQVPDFERTARHGYQVTETYTVSESARNDGKADSTSQPDARP
jgi:hypothetical protein